MKLLRLNLLTAIIAIAILVLVIIAHHVAATQPQSFISGAATTGAANTAKAPTTTK